MLESLSEGDFSLLIEEVLDKEFMNGSEFFLTKDDALASEGGLIPPPNFQTPIPPLCFHSSYDLIAKTQFTIREAFPPYKFKKKKPINEEFLKILNKFLKKSYLLKIRSFKSWESHILDSNKEVPNILKILKG